MLLALGLLSLIGLWWLGRSGGRLPFGLTPKRVTAYALLLAAGILGLRGQLLLAALVGLGAAWLLVGPDALGRSLRGSLQAYRDGRRSGRRVDADRDANPRPRRPLEPGTMTEQEAYQILGLERGASLEEVRTAHRSLMKRLHPDQGGAGERAALVNAARDRLTSRHR